MTRESDVPTTHSSLAVAVLGGGIVGLSIAFRLAESGWPVEVFDQGRLGSEASWAGAGMLAPGGEVYEQSPLGALSIESRALYRPFVDQLERESGLSIDLQEAGALELAYSIDVLDAMNHRAELQETLGIHSRPLSPTQVTAFWPRIRRERLIGARFYPGDAILDPRDAVAALQVALRARGAQIHENCAVKHVAVSSQSVELTTGSCPPSSYAAVVVAMGAWSSGLAVSGVPPLPVSEPVRGHLIGYQQPEQTCSTIIRLGATYLLQRAHGMLIVGASVERVGFDRTIQTETVADLERQASVVFPHLAETTPSAAWVGFRPGADALQLRPWHSPRLQLAYGHFRNGILLAPVTARMVTEELNASLGTR